MKVFELKMHLFIPLAVLCCFLGIGSQVAQAQTTYTSDPNIADFTSGITSYATLSNFNNSDECVDGSSFTPTSSELAGTPCRVYNLGTSTPVNGLPPTNNWILATFSSTVSTIVVFPNIDHFGSAYDGYQYQIYGSNDYGTTKVPTWTPLFDALTVTGGVEPFTLGTFTGTPPSTVNNVETGGCRPGPVDSAGSNCVGYEAQFTFGTAYKYYAFGASTEAAGNTEQELSAVGASSTQTTFTTGKQPIAPGTTTTFTYPNIITQTLFLPADVNLGDAAFMAVQFTQISPAVFDSTRLPATSTNLWSGGSPVPAGATLTPLTGTVGNANGIVAEKLCFAADNTTIKPCEIFAPTTLIQLTSHYETQAPQPNPALIIATDGQNDWANITEVFTPDPITGGSKGLNTDEAIVNLPPTMDTSNIIRVTGDFLNAGCIDNAGIVNALTSKLSAAQTAIGAGNIQTAINILSAFEKQVQAQSGKHIAASCTLAGITFDPATVLLTQVQSLIDNLRTSDTADPITAYVVDSNGLGISGATVSIMDSFSHTVATATTDITGFYFFPTTGVLASGSSYTVQVTLPSGFTTSTPAPQSFTWFGSGIVPSTFVLK